MISQLVVHSYMQSKLISLSAPACAPARTSLGKQHDNVPSFDSDQFFPWKFIRRKENGPSTKAHDVPL